MYDSDMDAAINRHPVIQGLPPCTQPPIDLAQRATGERLLAEATHMVRACHQRAAIQAYLLELGELLRGMGHGWYFDADERMRVDRAIYLQVLIREILSEVWP